MKKRRVLKENQIDLKHGFILELVKHPIGDVNGSLEGFLTYMDKEIDIDNKRFYSESTEAIRDFDNRIIPEFISKNNNIKVFKYLKDDAMFDFVKKYLIEKQLTYGMVIDVIKVLEEDGYAIPSNKDKTQVGNLIEFYLCVDRLSAEFKKHLKHFGFIADRNVNNTIDHPKFNKHEKCKNIVFTRYPWTNGFKAISIINDFVSITENDLSFNTDIHGEIAHSYNLFQIIPYVLVLAGGIIGVNVFVVLITGIISGIVIMLVMGGVTLETLLLNMGSGASGMFETCMVAVLVSVMCSLIKEYGGFDALLNGIRRLFKGKKGGQLGMGLLVGTMDIATANNTVAIVMANPIAKEMADDYDITPRKAASLLDTFSCIFQGIIPYGAQMLVAISAVSELGYSITAFQILPKLFYPMFLFVSSLIWIYVIPEGKSKTKA